MNAKGTSPLALYSAGDFDNVNPLSGNVYLSIPLLSYPQRGHALSLGFSIFYNSNLWFPRWLSSGGASAAWHWTEGGRNNVGARVGRSLSLSAGTDTNYSSTTYSDSGRNTYTVTRQDNSTWIQDSSGAKHYVGDVIYSSCNDQGRGSCPSTYGTNQKWFPASDSTGYFPVPVNVSSLSTVTDTAGSVHAWPNNYETITDTNGNTVTASAGGWTDTVGRTVPGGTSSPGPNDNIDANGGSALSALNTEPYPGTAVNVGATTCPSGTTSARTWAVPGVSNSTQTYFLCYARMSYQTAFNANSTQVPYYTYIEAQSSTSGNAAFTPANMLIGVMLPDGTSYRFSYDQYLSLTNLALPTGGSIAYTWVNLPYGKPAPGLNIPYRSVQTRTVYGGTHSPDSWSYYYTTTGDSSSNFYLWSVVTDPNGNDTEYQNNLGYTIAKTVYAGCGPHNAATNRTCSGSGAVVYNEAYDTSGVGSFGADVDTAAYRAFQNSTYRTGTTATFGNGSTAVTKKSSMTLSPPHNSCSYQYLPTSNPPQPAQTITSQACDSLIQPSQMTATDFGSAGSGQPGPALQVTNIIYQWQADGRYLSANIVDLVSAKTVTDGSGTQAAAMSNGYDESGSPQGVLGNNTSQTHWVDSSRSVTMRTSFTANGMPLSTTDGNLNQTTITYDANGIFPTQIARPNTGVAHVDNYSMDATTGSVLSHTDENNQTTQYSYQVTCSSGANQTSGNSFDPYARVQRITMPAVGAGTPVSTFCYTDSPNGWAMTATDPRQTSTTTSYDGLGRVMQVINNASGILSTTQYDFAGRITFTSNPEFSAGSVGTSFTYDPIGRMLSQTNADGDARSWQYSGSTTMAFDENANQVNRQSDGLGRLSYVDEVQPAGPAIDTITRYTYDALGNLSSVNQAGGSGDTSRIRTFHYDGLSHLLTAANPESGTICYGTRNSGACVNGYDNNGNLVSKTDARGVVTTYVFDALNRMTAKMFPGASTPSSCYLYDKNGGASPSNASGRLTAEWTQQGPCPTGVSQRLQEGSTPGKLWIATMPSGTC